MSNTLLKLIRHPSIANAGNPKFDFFPEDFIGLHPTASGFGNQGNPAFNRVAIRFVEGNFDLWKPGHLVRQWEDAIKQVAKKKDYYPELNDVVIEGFKIGWAILIGRKQGRIMSAIMKIG